jgi:hypothetical protein
MNGKWTQENFNLHDEKNPEIYDLFVKFALQVASRRSYYSAKNISIGSDGRLCSKKNKTSLR